MIYLSEAALQYAVAKCREECGYKIGIVPYQFSDNLKISRSLGIYLSPIPDYKVKRYADRRDIIFDNKSLIRIIPTTDASKGFRHHLLIADSRIPENILNTVFRPMETLERMKNDLKNETEIEEYICN